MIFSLVKILILFLVVGLVVMLSVLTYFTYKTQKSPLYRSFLGGHVPEAMPNGFYQGKVPGSQQHSWQGKEFDAPSATGINLFEVNSSPVKLYPFKTSVDVSLQDQHLQVIKIDYNVKQNPLWLRPVVDEIVEVTPNHYLGILNVRAFPFSVSFALGYFQLEKP